MIEILKGYGIGMVFVSSFGYRCFVEFKEIEGLGNDFYKTNSDKAYAVSIQSDPKSNSNYIGFTPVKHFIGSTWFVFKINDLSNIEIISQDSEFYKALVQSRSKIIMPTFGKSN